MRRKRKPQHKSCALLSVLSFVSRSFHLRKDAKDIVLYSRCFLSSTNAKRELQVGYVLNKSDCGRLIFLSVVAKPLPTTCMIHRSVLCPTPTAVASAPVTGGASKQFEGVD